jgi:hypothetical protein
MGEKALKQCNQRGTSGAMCEMACALSRIPSVILAHAGTANDKAASEGGP